MKKLILIFITLCCATRLVRAQNYPVQLTTQLTPPFSGYLSDYSTPGNENLKLLIYLTDFSNPVYDIKLKVKVEGQGITIQSKPFYYSTPFSLVPGQPLQLSGSDLAGLLNSNNLDFSGISKAQYEQRKVLPEGYYKICFTAYDNANPSQIKVSNESCAFGWMVLSDPPFLNSPICSSTVTITNPQNIMFSWTPMNMASPNSAANTDYEFSLYEIRPDGQNPNNIIQTLPPVFTTTVNTPFFNYGITETPLIAGMQYVWRVKAMDITGRDLFKNNGYSQICTFSWGTKYDGMGNLDIFLAATPLTHRSAKFVWDTIPVFTSYRLEYRKSGGNWNWVPLTTPNARAKVFDLDPDTDYEARVHGTTSDGYTGNWSNLATFHTPPPPVINCEDVSPPASMQNFQPLTHASIGMIWQIGQFEMTVTSLQSMQSGNGQYSGQGRVLLPFGGLGIAGSFTNVTVNNNQVVVAGSVEAITKGIDKWLSQHNDYNQYVYDDSYVFNGCIDSIYVNANNQVVITACDGQTTIIPNDISGGLLITDANGNQWVVNSDGSVTPVTGGGLLPATSEPLTADELNILKLAMGMVKTENTSTTVNNLKNTRNQKQQDAISVTTNELQSFNVTSQGNTPTDDIYSAGSTEETVSTNNIGIQKNKTYKEAEENYYVAAIANLFSKDDVTDEQLNFIGKYLYVGSKTYKEYVSQEKASGKTNQVIATAVKSDGIMELIRTIVRKRMRHD
ncbi:MAG: fibronectin type III domain-containing protein [Bacteroidetes bacterium]|nr:fibronectin type III domain-containing protein [Bacteroidota bacterium]